MMKLNSLVGFIFLYFKTTIYADPIIGGQNVVSIREYPYFASLRDLKWGRRHFCGGSIIDPRLVLTAAHCLKALEEKKRIPQDIIVAAGTLRRRSVNPDHVYHVKTWLYHENYTNFPNDDIGLVVLENKITFGDDVKSIELPTTYIMKENDPILLIGLGITSMMGDRPRILQELESKIVSHERYSRSFKKENFKMEYLFTSYAIPKRRAYTGDSGGPVIFRIKDSNSQKDVQVGLISMGFSVGWIFKTHLDIHIKISSYISWIEQAKEKLV